MISALSALHKRQMAESAAAGPAYHAGLADLSWYQGGEYVVTDELGMRFILSGTRMSSADC